MISTLSAGPPLAVGYMLIKDGMVDFFYFPLHRVQPFLELFQYAIVGLNLVLKFIKVFVVHELPPLVTLQCSYFARARNSRRELHL